MEEINVYMDNGYNKEAREILLSGMQKQKILKSLPPHDVNCEYWCKHDNEAVVDTIASALQVQAQTLATKHDDEIKELREAIVDVQWPIDAFDSCRNIQLTRKEE